MNNLKFSIITPSYNQGRFIKDTIDSVLTQGYPNFEHIIIDGGSGDNTLDVLKSYPHLKWISEKDQGSADAINKGIKMASGDIIAWLNSDDYYAENTFNEINKLFNVKNEIEIIIGNLTYVDENKELIFSDKTFHFDLNFLINISADAVRQPCSFFRKTLIDRVGLLNIDYKYVFDYDLFLKFMKVTSPLFVDNNFAFYREHTNTLTRKGLRKQAVEIFKVARANGGKIISKQTYKVIKKLINPKSFIVKRI